MNTVRIWCALAFILSSSAVLRAEHISVAAAADLNPVLQTLATQFEQKTGNQVRVSFASSGNLFSQIQAGAPFDLFFSADADYPAKLAAAELMDRSSLHTYAEGRLVLWVPTAVHLDPQKLKMNTLLQPAVQRIAIANPQHAPYGRAAMAALQHFELKEKLQDKLVFGENISQAAQFVESGNAQAGLIALSLASSPEMKAKGSYWLLPPDSYPPLRQVVGIVSASKQKKVAQAFLDYIASAEGKAMLEHYGFQLPPTK